MAQPAEVLASGIMDLVSRHNTFPVSAASARRTHADWEPRIGPDGAAELVRTDAYALRMVLTGMLGIAAGPVGVALGQLTAFGTLAAALLLLSIWNGYRMVRATVRAQKFGGLFLGLTNGHGGTLAVPVRHGVNFHDDWVRKMRASEMTS